MIRPLRILTPLHSFEPGGVERVALRLNAAWATRGVDVRVVLGRAEGKTRAEAPPLDYHVLHSRGVSTRAFKTLWMILRLPAVIRREQPDILFCAGNTYAIVAVAMRLLLGRRCPPIVAKISNDLARRDLIAPFRLAYHLWLCVQARFIDHFVGMAEPMRDEIAMAMWITRERVSIIEDPALTDADATRLAALRRSGSRGGGKHYLAVGRLVAQKNFAMLIRAFANMARPRDRLTILGEGPERGALEALAGKLGVMEKVAMPGHVHPLDRWLTKSDAFVLSSDYEGVPAVVIEALAASLPVIATDCSVSMGDLLDHGRLGRLVAVGDANAFAAAMAAPVEHADPRLVHAQARRFTVERAAGAYLAVMERIALVHRARRPLVRIVDGGDVSAMGSGSDGRA